MLTSYGKITARCLCSYKGLPGIPVFFFKLLPGRLDETIGEIEQLWKKVFPNDPFVYHFTDELVAVVYQTELQLKKASVIASVLILVIILTGVIGLVSLSLARRTKEIGIRKVLGASVSR